MEINRSTDIKELVHNAKLGDVNSIDRLMRFVLSRIKPLIMTYVHDGAHEYDVCQEVLIKVYRSLPRFREESHLTTWIYRISQNTIKNHFRTLSFRVSLEESNDETWDESQIALQNPESILMRMESNNLINHAISSLPMELQTSYVKCVFEGLSYEDIATQMNCPVGTVRSRIFRARKLIQMVMEDLS